MPNAHYHDTPDIVIAATLWLMHRYQQTGCKKLARMIEQHLGWMHDRATSPQLADACRRLSFEWRAVSCAMGMNARHGYSAPAQQTTLH